MHKIFIIHFQPLERYPPVMNLLRHLESENNNNIEVHVITSWPDASKKIFALQRSFIHRISDFNRDLKRIRRIMSYLQFTWKALSLLRKYKPCKILYFETLSCGAPFFYKSWFDKNAELFIHYHEYTSPREYRTGMAFGRWLHRLEKKLYKHASWVSQTNQERGRLFQQDLGAYAPKQVYILPNYPPASWKREAATLKMTRDSRVGFIYIGALNLDTMYVREFARYIKENSTLFFWDIYSDNFSPEVLHFVEDLGAHNISFKGGIEYDALPKILPHYDIGVILYKGHTPNYVYNAPNKLFEYLACGLNSWFPREMEGMAPYINTHSNPQVVQVNFNSLPDPITIQKRNRTKLFIRNEFFSDISLVPLTQKLFLNVG